tara:strand:- start:1150 stop:1356 length:207 start_codon:yes stop_codon:yes gene_type:complete
MGKIPYKMKYTNGKKADPSAFPFANQVENTIPTGGTDGMKDMIAAKIDEKVEEKVNKVVNQETGEGLV